MVGVGGYYKIPFGFQIIIMGYYLLDAENKSIQEQLSRKPISSTAIAAQSRLSLEEHKVIEIYSNTIECVVGFEN